MNNPSASRWCGAFALLIGATVLVGWALHVPALIRVMPNWATMVVNTALCLSIGGISLALSSRWRGFLWVQRIGGVTMFTLATLVFVENLNDVSFGIDWATTHRWLDDYPRAGRMAPNTSLGFMLIGLALALASRVSVLWRTWLRLGLALGAVAIGALGLLGYLLSFELLYSWSLVARMAVHTALGIAALGAGIWIGARQELPRDADENENGRHILAVVSGAVTIIAIVVALSTVAFMLRRVESITTEHLQWQHQDRSHYFTNAILQGITRAETVTSQNGTTVQLRRLMNAPGDAAARAMLQRIALSYLPQGFNRVVFSQSGRLLAEAGNGRGRAQMSALLDGSQTRELLWRDGFYLRLTLPIRDAKGIAGEVVTEQPLDALTNLMASTEKWGDTGEMVLCTINTDPFRCFPSRTVRSPFTVPLAFENTRLPISYAREGAGTVSARDYRGTRVIAAYGPIGTSGLGMVIKMDLAELYAPVLSQLKIALLVLGLTVLAIRALVRRRLQPLVRELVESRRAAKANEARFLTAAENNLDAFYILESMRNAHGEIVDFRFTYLNENGAQLISRKTKEEIVGRPLCEIFPLIRQQGFFEKYKRVAESGVPLLEEFPISAPNMKAIWLSEQVVRLGDGVAVTARDISDQKQAEEKLKYLAQNDMLTGLPNRALFFDRLKHAIVRSRRHKCSMALLFMDVDHFKQINDTLGHAAGDELLRTFADRLRICVRESDTAARLAGDEFTAILEDLNSIEDAEVVARRIVASMQEPIVLAGKKITFTSSIGVVMYPGSDREVSADELLEQADAALYEAKNQGRNRYAVYLAGPMKSVNV